MIQSPSQVTVIIPTRDRSVLVEAALRSVLRQTRPVDQIVVVDDGSIEPVSGQALARLSPVIELLRHDSARGVSAARNAGLERARGDVLLFLDDDDQIHPSLVEDALRLLEARPSLGGAVFLYEFFSNASPLEASDSALPPAQAAAAHAPDTLNPVSRVTLETRPVSAFLRYLIPVQSCVIRRAAIGETRFPETLSQGEDTCFWIAVAAAGCRFGFEPRIRAYVRRHEGNVTRSRARYMAEIQPCYRKLLDDRLLVEPDDVFLAHLKLAWFQMWTGGGRWRHLAHVLLSPRRLAHETAFWLGNLRERRRSPAVDAEP